MPQYEPSSKGNRRGRMPVILGTVAGAMIAMAAFSDVTRFVTPPPADEVVSKDGARQMQRKAASRAMRRSATEGLVRPLKPGVAEHRVRGSYDPSVIAPTPERYLRGYKPGTGPALEEFLAWKKSRPNFPMIRGGNASAAAVETSEIPSISNLADCPPIDPIVVGVTESAGEDAELPGSGEPGEGDRSEAPVYASQGVPIRYGEIEALGEIEQSALPPFDPSQVVHQFKPETSYVSEEELEAEKERGAHSPLIGQVVDESNPDRSKGALPSTLPTGPLVSWTGITGASQGGYPPDTIGTVGQNHVILAVNTAYRIYSKTGTPSAAVTSFGSLFTGTSCSSGFLFDPSADYDEENDRYILMIQQGASSSQSYLCIAVSSSADPTSTWYRYRFQTNGVVTGWLDNAEVAAGDDAIYVGGNMFTDAGAFSASMLYAFNKTNMYANTSAAAAQYNAGAAVFNPQPMHIRGFNQGQWPTAGTPFAFISRAGTGIQVHKWTAPFGANTVANTTVATTTGSAPPAAPQLSQTQPNDAGDTRFLDVDYRNGKLWASRVIASGGVAAIHWFQLDFATLTINQQNTYTTASTWLTYPTVAVDKNQSAAFGFTRSSTTEYPSFRITGRDAADTTNTLNATQTIQQAGTNHYEDPNTPTNRFGDYSGSAVDPDGCRLWFFGEYGGSATSADWRTTIGAFQFPSCNVNSSITLDKSLYDCGDVLTVSITDVTQTPNTWPASQVVLTTSNGDSESIAAASWTGSSCAGANCNTWTATINTSGAAGGTNNGTLNVANSGTITATYTDTHGGHTNQSRVVSVDCVPKVEDGGYLILGGCDETSAGEQYTNYMDSGELVEYVVGVYNAGFTDLNDVQVSLAITGAGASAITPYGSLNQTIGRIPAQTTSGVSYFFSIGAVAAMTKADLTFTVTSPGDGLTTGATLLQRQFLESDDLITENNTTGCKIHNSADFVARVYGTSPALPWSYIPSGACGGETRTDGPCDNATVGAMKTNTCTSTFASNADEIAFQGPFQPANTGNFGGDPDNPWKWAWKLHSFYSSTQTVGNTSGLWGVWYTDEWTSATAPTNGNAIDVFPYALAYYYQTALDGAASWDWEAANTGTPNNLTGTAPPNQFPVDLSGISGLSTSSTYFLVGHEGIDLSVFTGGTEANNRGFAIDNDSLIWDEYHTTNDATTCTTQCGVIGFDRYMYANNSSSDTVTITVLDGNAGAGPLSVTVSSGGTGDQETVSLTKVSGEPRYVGTITMYFNQGATSGDGMLYATPTDTLSARYNDADNGGGSPCADTAGAFVQAVGGDVVYVSNSIITENGSSADTAPLWADTNETVEATITIQNNMLTSLTNATVRISTSDPDILCIIKDTASYGTVAAGASATNSNADAFEFQVTPTTTCTGTQWQSPPNALFNVYISGTEINGQSSVQTYSMNLDLNNINGAGYTYTWTFDTNPGWQFGTGPGDDDGACAGQAYVSDWHYTATNGQAGGGFGAWQNDVAFNAGAANNYRNYNDAVLYTPSFTTTGNPTLGMSRAYGTEATYDGAAVQGRVNTGSWTYMIYTAAPTMGTLTATTTYCNPLIASARAWTGATTTWATVAPLAFTAAANSTVQFRFRLGSDSVGSGPGYGIDNVVISNIKQTVDCDTTDNSALPNNCSVGPTPPTGTPDGSFVAGTPMKGTKVPATSNVTVTWATCASPSADYNIYWGAIGSFGAITGGSCNLTTSGSWTGAVPDDVFWVLPGVSATEVSSFGRTSSGSQQSFTGWSGVCTQTTQNLTGTCN